MNRAALLALALIVPAQPLFADFHEVRKELRKIGFEQTWIPFLGLARGLVRVVHPKGVHDFQLAVYESTPDVGGDEIDRVMRRFAGKGFTPLVRVKSNRSGESVLIYARPSRNEKIVELIVLTRERGEAVLMRIAADAEIVGREMGVPEKIADGLARR
jgi:hypothetical protein